MLRTQTIKKIWKTLYLHHQEMVTFLTFWHIVTNSFFMLKQEYAFFYQNEIILYMLFYKMLSSVNDLHFFMTMFFFSYITLSSTTKLSQIPPKCLLQLVCSQESPFQKHAVHLIFMFPQLLLPQQVTFNDTHLSTGPGLMSYQKVNPSASVWSFLKGSFSSLCFADPLI